MTLAAWMTVLVLGVAGGAAAGPDALLEKLNPGTNRIHDSAGVLSGPRKSDLESFLQSVERATSVEIAIVAVPTLEGADVDDFASRLFDRWGIGKKAKDNGILLLAALEDRAIRIEVGYGLEATLPDARAGRILDDHVIPRFRDQHYADGLISGAIALAGIAAEASGVALELPESLREHTGLLTPADAPPAGRDGESAAEPSFGAAVSFFVIVGGVIAFLVIASRKGWIKASPSTGRSGGASGFGGGFRSGGGGGFGGGRSGGGGASRKW